MAYCQYCGAQLNTDANFCPNCGAAMSGSTAQQATDSRSDATKTILTAAGTAAGVSLLANALRRNRRHRIHFMPPHRGRFHGPMGPMHPMGGHGPMGGREPMGGPGRGPGRR